VDLRPRVSAAAAASASAATTATTITTTNNINTRTPPYPLPRSAESPRIEQVAVPLAETWAAMEALVDAGLAAHIGICNVMVSGCMYVCV
jgi:diketogulonate reductase-like aldo/keto reductase